MHVTASLAGGEQVDVEVGEECRTLRALKKAIVKELPKLRVKEFAVCVGGHALDDEGVVSLEDSMCLDVVPDTRIFASRALREIGRKVSEDGLLRVAFKGNVALCALYLDAGMPIDCVNAAGNTPLHISCWNGNMEVATLLLNRGSAAMDKKNDKGETPLFVSCHNGHLEIATLFLDLDSTAIDTKNEKGETPLFVACHNGHLRIATLLLDRRSTAIDEKNDNGETPLFTSYTRGYWEIATLLLDRGSTASFETFKAGKAGCASLTARDTELLELLSDRISKQ